MGKTCQNCFNCRFSKLWPASCLLDLRRSFQRNQNNRSRSKIQRTNGAIESIAWDSGKIYLFRLSTDFVSLHITWRYPRASFLSKLHCIEKTKSTGETGLLFGNNSCFELIIHFNLANSCEGQALKIYIAKPFRQEINTENGGINPYTSRGP